MRNILASMAEYERELIRERVRAGQERGRAHGVKLGRKPRPVDLEELRRRRAAGQGWRRIARALKTPRSTFGASFRRAKTPLGELRHASALLTRVSGRAEGKAAT
jgi:DNA invertase Pin-like site-specific DNA recombinase